MGSCHLLPCFYNCRTKERCQANSKFRRAGISIPNRRPRSAPVRADLNAAVNSRIANDEVEVSVLVLGIGHRIPRCATVVGAIDAGGITGAAPGEPANEKHGRIIGRRRGRTEADGIGLDDGAYGREGGSGNGGMPKAVPLH